MNDVQTGTTPTADFGVLAGGGEMGERVRAHDWAATPLGPRETWPPSLSSVLSACLNSPMLGAVLWGPDLLFLYNDAYIPTLANGHPSALGLPVSGVWGETWDRVGSSFQEAMRTGVGFARSRVELPMVRRGRLEATWWDFTAAPILGDGGEVLGLLSQGVEITGQVRGEGDLRQGEERLRLATEHAEIGFWDVDIVNNLLIWPPRVKAMFGISPDVPVTLLDFFEGLHPGDREATSEAYAGATDPARRELYDVEYRTVGREDGVVRWVAAKGRGLFDDSGRCVRVIGTAIEITRRKTAEAALRESEERLRAINADLERQVAERTLGRGTTWQITPDLMGVLNTEGYFEQSNPAWATVLGWSEAEVARTVFFDFLHPDDLAKTQAAFADAVERGLPAIHFENRYRTKGGAWRWLQWVAVPEDGKVYATARDVTEAKSQAEALAESTRERERLWQSSQDLLLVARVDTTIVAINPAWTQVLGWDEAELVGQSFMGLIHPEDMAATAAEAERLSVEGRTAMRFENRFQAKDETWVWLSWAVSSSDGLFHAVARDITADKVRQVELARAQDALRQSQKMEAVGQLTGGIAHDFNNLLQGVAGSLDLIRRRPDDAARIRRWAEAGLQAAERGARLTGQLLAFSRSQKLELRPLALTELVTGFSDMLDRTIGGTIRVRLDLQTDGVHVLGDEVQLEMAILNLALNARDAMPEGGDLTVRTSVRIVTGDPELPDGAYAELAVSDTGVGMSPEVVARAFDPFFTTKGVGKGTGLGLSQAYGMVRQAGGGAELESELGVGTTVRLLLRQTEAVAPEAGVRVDAPVVAGPEALVLIIDDDPDVRRFLADSLDALGYGAVEAPDGQAGLAAVERSRPDIVILDFAMPGITGADVARQIRATHPDLPIIFATGFSESAAIEEAVGASAAVLRKPFRVDELQAALTEALHGSARS